MSSKNENYYRLGINIRSLRKAVGLTQEELAHRLSLEMNKQSVSQYELGDRIPERDILLKIAEFFGVTVDELLYCDYSKIESMFKKPISDINYNVKIFNTILPLVCSDEALKNSNFKEAYELHMKVYQDLVNMNVKDSSIEEINRCIDLYDKATENGVIEGVANSLWWILLWGIAETFCKTSIVEKISLLQSKKISSKDFFKNFFSYLSDNDSDEDKSFKESRIKFIKDNEIDIIVKIRLLKLSKVKIYSDLGDYYLSLIYIFNLIDNGESRELNRNIGISIMNLFAIMGNTYAENFSGLNEDL